MRLGQLRGFNNTLNHPTNSCNAFLAGETAMMGKEHFIETFGVPQYTVTSGGSGGAYTSLQIADAFPGLFDGVEIRATFPDAFAIANSGEDARLLMHYYTATNPAALSDAQKLAVGGYEGLKAMLDAANQSQRMDPVPGRQDIDGYKSASWNAAVPDALRYTPDKNPKHGRPSGDAARNVYGVNPATGGALRSWDNTGVQYGLNALNAGVITTAQFLDLNEKIGGVDQDSGYTSARSAGDPGAIRRTYQAGLMLGANGGLTAIPIFDNATSNETGGYHYGWFHFALRERVRQANNGNSDTMVMWRSVSGNAAREVFDRWVAAYKDDTSSDPQRVKVLRAKPADAVDGCFDKATPASHRGRAAVRPKPTSKCSELPGIPTARAEAASARRQHHQVPAEGGRCERLPRRSPAEMTPHRHLPAACDGRNRASTRRRSSPGPRRSIAVELGGVFWHEAPPFRRADVTNHEDTKDKKTKVLLRAFVSSWWLFVVKPCEPANSAVDRRQGSGDSRDRAETGPENDAGGVPSAVPAAVPPGHASADVEMKIDRVPRRRPHVW